MLEKNLMNMTIFQVILQHIILIDIDESHDGDSRWIMKMIKRSIEYR